MVFFVSRRLMSPLILSYTSALAALVLFEWIAEEVLEGDTIHFDQTIRAFVHGLASPGLTVLMRLLTEIGTLFITLPATAILCVVLWRKNRRNGAILLAATMTGAVLLMYVLKLVFHRHRPDSYFGYPVPQNFSFPSGHALGAFCFCGVVAVIASSEVKTLGARIAIWTAAVLLTVGIGLSRIYLGVHYPSDVLGGYLAATVWVSGVGWIYRHYRRRSDSLIGDELG